MNILSEHIMTHKRRYIPPLIDIVAEEQESLMTATIGGLIPKPKEDPENEYSKSSNEFEWGSLGEEDNDNDFYFE